MIESETTACPCCGDVAERTIYDIGSGPELACASCEWCWGAEGQDLQPLSLPQCEHTGQSVDRCLCMVHDPDGAHFQATRGPAS